MSVKLMPQDVTRIRELYATGGIRQWEIGKLYGVTQSMVSKLVLWQAWTGVKRRRIACLPTVEQWDIDWLIAVSEARNARIAANPSGFPVI